MRLINGVRKSDWPAMAWFATGMRVLRASRLDVSPGVRVIVHAPAARFARPMNAGVGTGEVRLGVRSVAFGILSIWKGDEKRGDCLGPPPAGSQERTNRGRVPGKMPGRLPRRKWDAPRDAMPGVIKPPGGWRQIATRSLSRWRAMTMRWISDVPSPISPIFASRIMRSTGYSLV
jgi:hypothetical protein